MLLNLIFCDKAIWKIIFKKFDLRSGCINFNINKIIRKLNEQI